MPVLACREHHLCQPRGPAFTRKNGQIERSTPQWLVPAVTKLGSAPQPMVALYLELDERYPVTVGTLSRGVRRTDGVALSPGPRRARLVVALGYGVE